MTEIFQQNYAELEKANSHIKKHEKELNFMLDIFSKTNVLLDASNVKIAKHEKELSYMMEIFSNTNVQLSACEAMKSKLNKEISFLTVLYQTQYQKTDVLNSKIVKHEKELGFMLDLFAQKNVELETAIISSVAPISEKSENNFKSEKEITYLIEQITGTYNKLQKANELVAAAPSGIPVPTKTIEAPA